jgi:3-deoxy-D-manno-octulosonic-acid transferase
MLAYSGLLSLALLLSAPWWVLRMLATARYREGLGQRLGRVPARLCAALASGLSRPVIWVHAVSVGEVLAVSRLVNELEAALPEQLRGTRVVVSTTTRTGQALARERFGAERVFYMPLDFGWAVRRYLRALRPAMLVLVESELWPRMLHECKRAGIPVAVVNARVSDRSFRRGMRLRAIWQRVLRKPVLWLAQSEPDATRLKAMGARPDAVHVTGNLKYDIRAPRQSHVAEQIRSAAAGRPIVVAGSTVDAEDEVVLAAFAEVWASMPGTLLVVAPRHPERFKRVLEIGQAFGAVLATSLSEGGTTLESRTPVVVLNTIGDLAAVYGTASAAFVGGSIVAHGGHNPLEPAQFGIPVVMGPSFQNFRSVVEGLRAANAIRILNGEALPSAAARTSLDRDTPCALRDELAQVVIRFLEDHESARAMGERGRAVFQAQQGATARTVQALIALLTTGRGAAQ